MGNHNHAPRPRWQVEPQQWQAELLANPHLQPGEKLTVIALSKRFTGWEPAMIDLGAIAQETGQTIEDVHAQIERLHGVIWEVVP